MKIAFAASLGLALVAAASAFADQARKSRPLYTVTGRLCTADEVANPPQLLVSVNGSRPYKARLDCRTRAEWKLVRTQREEYERDLDRWRRNTLNTSHDGFVEMPRRPDAF